MTKLNEIVRLLEDQRRDLLKQLDAVESAIAALGAADAPASETPEAPIEALADGTAPGVSARRVKARRVLSDSHKVAAAAGKRKARGAREAAKGLAREMLDDAFVPAIGARGDHQPPRLVRRPVKRS